MKILLTTMLVMLAGIGLLRRPSHGQALEADQEGGASPPAAAEARGRMRAEAWVKMLGNDMRIEDLWRDHFSPRFHERMPQQRARMIFGVLRQFYEGGPVTVEESVVGRDAVVLRLSNVENRWAEYELQFEPDDEHFLLGGFNAQILGVRPSSDWDHLTLDELLAKTSGFLDQREVEDRFSGTVLIGRRGEVLLEKTAGFRDVARSKSIGVRTPFPVASVSKAINAIAVAVLVDQGKLALDAAVGRYWPEVPNARIRDEVTIEQLLMHTSGISSMLLADDLPDSPARAGLEAAALAVVGQPLSTSPGETYQYSNGGPILLGYLIERVSGQAYEDFVARHVLAAAGMKNSGFLRAGHYPEQVAVGSFTGPSGREATTEQQFEGAVNPSNSLYSTAGDLFRLNQALFRSTVFDASILGVLTAHRIVANSTMDYTTGLMRKRFDGRFALGHTGGMPGISAQWWYMPETEISLIVLSNRSEQAADVAERLLGALATVVVDT